MRKGKDQIEYENTVCLECGHKRGDHAGIDEWCYKPGCKCMKFTESNGAKQ